MSDLKFSPMARKKLKKKISNFHFKLMHYQILVIYFLSAILYQVQDQLGVNACSVTAMIGHQDDY